jgi:hypothetical protein
MAWAFRILLLLNIIVCIGGAISKRYPAWRMFERVEPLRYRFLDKDGGEIALRDYMPKEAYINHHSLLLKLAIFACQKNLARAPFTLIDDLHHTTKVLNAHCEAL